MSDDRIQKLEARVSELEKVIAGLRSVFGGAGAGNPLMGIEPADEEECRGKFGDFVVRKSPTERYWSGESFAGWKMSECTIPMLEAFAKYKAVCAKMNDKDPAKAKYAEYDRRDASRALGWKVLIETGKHVPAKRSAPTSFAEPSFGGSGGSFGDDNGFGDAYEPPLGGIGEEIPFVANAINLGWGKP